MSKIRESIGERLVNRSEKEKLESTYNLGDWDYDENDLDCGPVSLDGKFPLYNKYCCTDYGSFKSDRVYAELHKMVCSFINASVRANKPGVISLIDTAMDGSVSNPAEDDERLHNHLSDYYDPLHGDRTEVYDEAADIWLRYIMERGPNPD